MEQEYLCTVAEAIQTPVFREAQVIAGRNGLAKPIRWVHILETRDFDTLIHGGEMILTTGMGMQQEGSSPLFFLDNLIQRHAACLCIELGSRLHAVPEEMKTHADKHAFPLIVFSQTVRFVDITLELHSLLVHLHHKKLQETEERKKFANSTWLEALLHENAPDERQLKRLLGPDFPLLDKRPYRVCLLEMDHGQPQPDSPAHQPWLYMNRDYEADGLHLSLIVRSLLERMHFHPVISITRNRLVVLIFDLQRHSAPSKEKLESALLSLRKQHSDEQLKNINLTVGISRPQARLQDVFSAYQEATQALMLCTCSRKLVLFYEELGIFQLLLNLNDGSTLESFVHTYLGPIIHYDETKGSELLLTLRVYLDHDGSKQIAARKLFIVRQSLYYRLEKITELLGKNFMEPENRLSIQVALRAYQLLYPDKLRNPRNPSSVQR